MVGLERGTVELVPHDPAWRRAYEREVDRLSDAIGDRVDRFEHVGSTAIAGVPAKPIVDVLALVPDLEATTSLAGPLTARGYEDRPDDVAGRELFAKGPRSNRTHYLHVAETGSEYAAEMLAFRDHLRANPDAAAAYADLKRDLADRHPDDRDAYTAGKRPFVERILDEATDGRRTD